ncbi:MAG: NlpC/P60 family protein [Verrucomicrobiota bacterium]
MRKKLWLRWVCLWPVMLGLWLYPVSNLLLRAAVLLTGALLIGGILVFYWKNRWLRITTIAIVAACVVFLLLPGRVVEPAQLSSRYLSALENYDGSKYVWGGEGYLGIDCSGLVRVGLINALARQSVATFNPEAARLATRLWWNDCSARALGEEYQNLTRHLFDATALNELNYAQLQPGDIAVTEDGLHVLAYLGKQVWIQAEPNLKRVIKIQSPSTNDWFQTPVKVMRWQVLESNSQPNQNAPLGP